MSNRIIDLTEKTTPDGYESIPATEQQYVGETTPMNKRFSLFNIKEWIKADVIATIALTECVEVVDINLTSGVEYNYANYTSNVFIIAVIFPDGTTGKTLKVYDGNEIYKEDNSDINTPINLYVPKSHTYIKFMYTGSGTTHIKLITFKWA